MCSLPLYFNYKYSYIMKIDIYTLMYNEEKIIPFVVQYWDRLNECGVLNTVYILNNESTDNSVDMVKDLPYVQIINWTSNNTFDDIANMQIKNTVWKNSRGKVDYVYVCDFDEVLYGKDIVKSLEKYKAEGIEVIETDWWNLISDIFPTKDDNLFVHELPYIKGVNNEHDKILLFSPNVENMNYSVGSHTCRPTSSAYAKAKDIQTFHLTADLSLEYKLWKYHRNKERLSENNKRFGLGIHYAFEDTKIKEEHAVLINKGVKIVI